MANPIVSPAYAFTFGSQNLIGSDADMAANGYRFYVCDDDGDLGTPDAIEETVVSWLQDGAIVALQGYSNRDMHLRIMVQANDGTSLALGEAALMQETGQPNTLIYQPADATAPASVFSVVMSHLEVVNIPAAERAHTRFYGLKITAEPFARSENPFAITQAAPAGALILTTVDDGTSTTGWTGTPNSPTTSGGVIRETYPALINESFALSLKRSSLSSSMTTTPYLRIDWGVSDDAGFNAFAFITNIIVRANNVILSEVASNGTVHWYDYAAANGTSTLTSVQVSVQVSNKQSYQPVTNYQLQVSDVSKTNLLVDSGASGRQLQRVVSVPGSARTQGNLAISDATNALGTTLVHTIPGGQGLIQPNLRVALTSGNTPTPDSTCCSAASSDLSALHTFDVLASGLISGAHLLLARVKHTSSGARTLTWAARARQGSSNVGTGQSGATSVTLVANAYAIVTVAKLTLPTRKLGANGLVRIELTGTSSMTLDEAWLFNIETGRLTQVECGIAAPFAGGTSNRLWLDAPTLSSGVPAVYLGHAADRSDSFHASSELTSLAVHEFDAGLMSIYTVTPNSTASSITLSGFARWMTHAAA